MLDETERRDVDARVRDCVRRDGRMKTAQQLNECGGRIPRSEGEWMDVFPVRQRTGFYTLPAIVNNDATEGSPNTNVTLVHRSTLVAPASVCTLPVSRRRLLHTPCLARYAWTIVHPQ
jgi:hypothetical protein